jgi:phosphohistidine phosphatase
MKTLLIMRHAKSSWKQDDLPDHDRPLNKRGRRDAPHMGALLKDKDLVPQLIVCSDAVRARATADAVAEACGYESDILESADLYESGPQDYLGVLAGLTGEPDRVLIIGHNPAVEGLIGLLTGELIPMGTATIANVTLPLRHWAGLNGSVEGRVAAVWRPKETE